MRAVTTTTAMPGFATSATRGTRSRRQAPTRCSIRPWASYRTGFMPTGPGWFLPIPPAATGCRTSAGWICPGIRVASISSATGSTGNSSWTRSASASLEVGGDWYGVVELPEGRRAVVGEVGRGSRLHHGVLRHHRPPQQHSASQQRRALPALLAEPDGTVRQLNHAMSPPLAVAADRDRPEAT